jgi:hypothetical protein
VTRSNRRPLLAGAVAASAALATGLLAACSAGQVAQTAGIEPAVPGVSAQTVGYPVYVRNAVVDYSEPKGYRSGAKAPLALWIFNNSHQPVSLVSVTAAQGNQPAQVVLSTGSSTASSASPGSSPACSVPTSPSAVPAPTATASASPSASASSSASKAASPSGSKPSGSASASASASPSASPSPSAAGATTIKVTIPAGGCVELSKRAAQYLQAVDLPNALGNADSLAVTFGFTTADGQTLSTGAPLSLPVAPPASAGPRPSPTE